MVWCSHIAMCPSDHAREPAEPPEYTLWLMKRAWQNGHRALSEAVRIYDITPTQLGALNELVNDPGPSRRRAGTAADGHTTSGTTGHHRARATGIDRTQTRPEPSPNSPYFPHQPGTQRHRRLSVPRTGGGEPVPFAILDEEERSTLIDFLLRLAKQAPSHLDDADNHKDGFADSEESPVPES